MTNPIDRIALLELVNQRFPNGVGVEIGVAGGHFTKQILASWPTIGKLYCIDAWQHFETGYDDSCNLSQKEQDERYERIILDFGANPNVTIMRAMSHQASHNFTENSVDFIYLDANHCFSEVMRDLTCWWPILKRGGIFAGHDYLPGNGKGYGVKLAVDEWAKREGIPVGETINEYCQDKGVYGKGWEGKSFVMENV